LPFSNGTACCLRNDRLEEVTRILGNVLQPTAAIINKNINNNSITSGILEKGPI
jgi:hypothetical protein